MAERRVDRAGLALGVAFIAAGVLFLLDRLEVISLRPSVLLPIFLIALGVAILLGVGRER